MRITVSAPAPTFAKMTVSVAVAHATHRILMPVIPVTYIGTIRAERARQRNWSAGLQAAATGTAKASLTIHALMTSIATKDFIAIPKPAYLYLHLVRIKAAGIVKTQKRCLID